MSTYFATYANIKYENDFEGLPRSLNEILLTLFKEEKVYIVHPLAIYYDEKIQGDPPK
jgi:hypothetical protein